MAPSSNLAYPSRNPAGVLFTVFPTMVYEMRATEALKLSSILWHPVKYAERRITSRRDTEPGNDEPEPVHTPYDSWHHISESDRRLADVRVFKRRRVCERLALGSSG